MCTTPIIRCWAFRRRAPPRSSAYHALAIDERRKPFLPAIWEVDTPGQDVEQVWFAGVHSNVGGGYPDCGLSDIALEWMMGKATGLGLEFEEEYVKMAVTCAPEGELYESMSLAYKLFHPFMRPAFKDGRRVLNAPRPPRDGKPVRTCERVHESVYDRFTRVTSPPKGPYAPPNLPVNLATPAATRIPEIRPLAAVAADRAESIPTAGHADAAPPRRPPRATPYALMPPRPARPVDVTPPPAEPPRNTSSL
jgi:hypothetical protein